MTDIRTVELFAGVGGFRLGLEAASERFKFIWANQWEPRDKEQYAFSCYERHFGHNANHVCKDIAKVIDQVPEHDLLVGGFPCQDYSIANSCARGIDGKKGSLWWQIEKVLSDRHPGYVLLENVDGILTSPSRQKGRDYSMILRSFYQESYAVEWRVINAADYGQAQRRRRIFILAYHRDSDIYKRLADIVCKAGSKAMHKFLTEDGIFAKAFPVEDRVGARAGTFIDELEFSTMDDLSRSLSWEYSNAGVMMNGMLYTEEVSPIREPPIFLRQILETGVPGNYDLREADMDRWVYLKGPKREMRTDRTGRTYFFSEGAVPFPDVLDRPARTMLTSESSVSRSSHVVKDPETGKLRVLTPVECERLNGFPDGWTEGMPEKYRYFTMGNALVVPIITSIGKTLVPLI